jgi:large subunit ribosomal protein L3
MAKGILGRKIGMTQVFAENGDLIPVTVIEASANVVLQVKNAETDGYEAIQLGFEDIREKLSNKPAKGHATKANTAPKRFIRELRGVDASAYEVGQEVKVDIFAEGDVIDVTGISKGKVSKVLLNATDNLADLCLMVLATTVAQVQWVL